VNQRIAPADLAACAALLRDGSKSFFAASLLLPRRVRAPAAALYAFCRVADDAVDLSGAPAAAVAALHRRLDAAYAGEPQDDPVDRALAAVIAAHALPRAHLDALLDGFLWDAEGRRYATIGDLRAYAARVASAVGVMMTLLMGEGSPEALARACDLGVAMQLTNIARDVGEDARAGRLYLPADWMREAGLDPETWLADPIFDARLASVVARVLAEAQRLYDRSGEGIGLLPRDCRAAIHAARLIYAEIGAVVAAAGHDSVGRRAVVPGRRKLRLLAKALIAAAAPGGRRRTLPAQARQSREPGVLAEVRFLVEAAAPHPAAPAAIAPSVGIPAIFEKAERKKREAWAATLPA